MPIYEYSCRQCGAEFERLVGPRDAVACPSCASGRVTRRISLVGIKTGTRAAGAPETGAGGCCAGGCACH